MNKVLSILTALALLCCIPVMHADAAQTAVLRLEADVTQAYGGDRITISMYLTAENMGGLQTTLTWNDGYLTYVDGSAAFADAFASRADMQMINDARSHSISLVYGCTSGYTCEEEAVFTADFVLNNGVSGYTTFELANTKLTNAAVDLAAMEVQTHSASVHTAVYNAGSAWFKLAEQDANTKPYVGERITVNMNVSTSGPLLGSMQGEIVYDSSALAYVKGSAAFSDAYGNAAVMQLINDTEPGKISFVYASMNGCSEKTALSMQFDVTGGANKSVKIYPQNLKATNTETTHLAMMNCYPSTLYVYPAVRPEEVCYTVGTETDTVAYNDVVTVSVWADGTEIGGLQGKMCYDAQQLIYVEDSAAFSEGISQNAIIKMVNAAQPGQIRFVYTSADGYTPDGSAIFTAQFKVAHCGSALNPITLNDLKTTNASAEETKEITSLCLQPCVLNAPHIEVVDEAETPTCTESGLTEGAHCERCLEVLKEQEPVPEYGHNEVTDEAKTPTCTESGLTEGSHCGRCSEVLKAQETIPATGHNLSYEQSLYETTVGAEPITIRIVAHCGHDVEASITACDRLTIVASEAAEAAARGAKCGVATVTAVTNDAAETTATVRVIVHAKEKMDLPAALTAIREEAFAGISAEEIVLTEQIESIGERAFAECGDLMLVTLPDGIQVDDLAFEDCSQLTILCSENGSAQRYAQKNKIPFIIR